MPPEKCPIAIVGIGCRFPPDIVGPKHFWSFLDAGGDAVGSVPDDRWSWRAFYDPDLAKPSKMHVGRGAFLTQPIEEFDAAFFRISPREAAQLDPQQRVLFEVSWEALEDAGLNVWTLAGSSTGVFIGAFTLDNMVQRNEPNAREDMGAHTAMTCTHTVLAGRLSYFYDFRGPSFVVDTACSSSLVAIHQAIRSLQTSECDLALAGGVNRMFRPETSLMMAKGHFLAADGRSKSFSATADGYGRGEGCGVVVLKRLEDARRDGDRIWAVVEGSGVNQDGRTGGPAFPSADAQAELIETVLSRAGIDPDEISYVEAHGTGTPTGDPAEMRALGQILGEHGARTEPCVVGSVKAGIGHLEAAAGVAGFIKAALVAHNHLAPPQGWLDELNPDIDFGGLGLTVATEPLPLRSRHGRLNVAVNSFGYAGTNAHAVLRAPSSPGDERGKVGSTTYPTKGGFFAPVALVSAHSEPAVAAMAADYAARLRDAVGDEPQRQALLAAFAARSAHEYRRAVVGPSVFQEALEMLSSGGHHPDLLSGRTPGNRPASPVFVFSGMGPQWWGMGRSLLESHTGFRDHVKRCDDIFRELAGWSIIEEMMACEEQSQIARTEVAQPVNFVLQTGLAAVLAELGVNPSAVVGHSVGEIAAAYVSGCLDLEGALTVAYQRSRLQATTAGTGGMLATELNIDDAYAAIAPFEPEVSIAALNAPNATTIVGSPTALAKIQEKLASGDVFSRLLRVDVPYHSPAMDSILAALRHALRGLKTPPATVPIYSTVTESFDGGRDWDADYWTRNVREPVNFHAAMSRLVEDGHRVFLELGAHPVLALYLHQILGDTRDSAVVTTLHRDRYDGRTLTEAVVQLWLRGVPVDWAPILGAQRSAMLPTYPWQRERHWQESATVRRIRTGEPCHDDVLYGRVVSQAPPCWDLEISPTTIPWCRDHLVTGQAVFPAAGFIEVLISHARDRNGGSLPAVVEDIRIDRPLLLPEHQDPVIRVVEGDDGRVTLSSRRRDDNLDDWRTNVSARIGRGRYRAPTQQIDDPETATEVAAERLYDTFAGLGLRYHGHFRSIQRLSVSEHFAESEIDVQEDIAGGYTAYPPTVDAGLQTSLALQQLDSARPFIPVRVRRAVFYHPLRERVIARCSASAYSTGTATVDITFSDDVGNPLAVLYGVELQELPQASPAEEWLDQRTYEQTWTLTNSAERRRSRPPRAWLLVGMPTEVSDTLHDLDPLSREITQVSTLADVPDSTMTTTDAVVINIAARDTFSTLAASERTIGAVQRIAQCRGGTPDIEIVLVTSNSVAVLPQDCSQGWLAGWVSGLRRALANELNAIRVRQIDHDDTDLVSLSVALADTDADELALRGSQRYCPSLERRSSAQRAESWWEIAPACDLDTVTNFGLDSTAAGFDGLRWVARKRDAPGPGEIELRVEAVGLNYKDVVKQLRLVSDEKLSRTHTGSQLGMEQCVVVERVGTHVEDFKPGQRFIASLPAAFCRYATVNAKAARLIAVYPQWSHIEAAGQLVAMATAHRSIAELGRLQPDEILLLHGATGGVGLAALQVARSCGARVFATAGTPAKRELLHKLGVEQTFDSRSLNFVEDIRAATAGRGVDVVLNTLPGDGLRANLEIAAEGARVIEIGKQEILAEGQLPLNLFDKNLTLISFDLDYLANDHAAFKDLGERVLQRVRAGDYGPVPVTSFPASKVGQAFNLLARSQHMGKVVVDLTDSERLVCHESPPTHQSVRADRWYLITGGTGGIGLQAADWLVSRGARHLVLASRGGILGPRGQQQVSDMRDAGVDVDIVPLDVTDSEDLNVFVAGRREAGIPLGGVMHCAGVTRDKPALGTTSEDFREVFAPKLLGALALHHATLEDPVDFFLITSSVSSLTGTSGQSSYAAANSAVESFVQWRRRSGHPAVAITLGPVAEVGMAAADETIERYVRVLGFEPIPLDQLAGIFDRALQWNRPVLAIFDIDWIDWAHAEPVAAATHQFQQLVSDARSAINQSSGAAWDRIALLPEEKRHKALASLVADNLATVLGANAQPPDLDSSLATLGLDSLMLVELQTNLNRALGGELSLMGLLDANTVRDVAKRLDEMLT